MVCTEAMAVMEDTESIHTVRNQALINIDNDDTC